MITLEPVRLHWIKDDGCDDPGDVCAHSPVRFEIDSQVIVKPEDGDWTASASAIFLLRALNRDHTKASPVGDQIFPCCGHGIFDGGQAEVVIVGCPVGINVEIRHEGGCYRIVTEDSREFRVPQEQWREAVFDYSDQVMRFYKESRPKEREDEADRKAFQAMMAEWRRLRTVPGKLEHDAKPEGESACASSSPVSEPRDLKLSGTFFAESWLPMADYGSAQPNSRFLKIAKRISLISFGLLSCLVGFASALVAIALTVASLPDIDSTGRRIFMAVQLFIITEMFLAFGITAFLLGLKYIFGPKRWTSILMDVLWKKAMKFALAIPVLVFGGAAILKLIDWLLK